MKDLMVIWNTLSHRQIYSSVNINPNGDKVEQDEAKTNGRVSNIQRKSSVMVNKFFNTALPVHSDGRRRWSKNIFMLMTFGLLGLTCGCLIVLYQPYESLFQWKLTLGEGGESFELWRKPEVDLYVKIYLFNVTNRDEYLSGKESKLRFQQVGPYVYKLLQSITNVMKDASFISRWGLNTLIRQTDTHPLVQMTAHEFMFGYQSTLVILGNHLMPSWIKFDKLGLIDRMYDFDGDFETIYTGETDIRLAGLIDKYNGDVNLPQWTGKCANVHGSSDGVKFPSYIKPNDTLLFFRKSLCRSERMVILIIAIITTKWLNSLTKNLLPSHACVMLFLLLLTFFPYTECS
ncbi:platelet glycoprotein 4-like [Pogonomyrmex barbatus]|uniref:Platelet glycoprotein 4-like n=1 Tax=Pogonomyrmex barbatus TaxID=144034 RepID=A0A8N1S7W7_9HYME|nr:platelet glycoprotein 4-like [Pogonomyrmex barbatus]